MSEPTAKDRVTLPNRRCAFAGAVAVAAAATAVLFVGWLVPTLVQAQADQPASKTAAGEPAAAGAGRDGRQGAKAGETVEAGMREAFAQLADPDADVREAARVRLMGVERRYLPAFQKLVERDQPLLPPQAAVLRQVVTHIYLAGEPYNSNANLGFLGVRMLDADVAQVAQPPEGAGGGDAVVDPDVVGPDGGEFPMPVRGVLITERMPGFVGHRMLLDGDMIVGFTDRPGFAFSSGTEFSEEVRQVGAGRSIRFTLLRRGRITTVEVTLDPRPDAATDIGSMADLIHRRRQKADEYWETTFAPMLKESVG